MTIKTGVFDMIGKTVKEIIVNEYCVHYPDFHVFIVFDDDLAYEFYGGDIHSANGLYKGLEYAKSFKNCKAITRYYRDENGKYRIEEVAAKS